MALDEFRAGSKSVRDRVEGELCQQGYTKEDAATNAALTEAYFTRLAHDWRESDPTVTPLKLFERIYGVGPMVVGGRDVSSGLFSLSAMKSPEANIRRGREAMSSAILERSDKKRAMFREGFGLG